MHIQQRKRMRGFTLIELTVVVLVIAVLVALLSPVILDFAERSRHRSAVASLNTLQKTYARFQGDVGQWPYGDGVWRWWQEGKLAFQFDSGFTAFHRLPFDENGNPMEYCGSGNIGGRCWSGPYMTQHASLGALKDPWNKPYRYLYAPPYDPDDLSCVACSFEMEATGAGLVMIFSTGPDGMDQTTCEADAQGVVPTGAPLTAGGPRQPCIFDWAKARMGRPSIDGADDVILVVSDRVR